MFVRSTISSLHSYVLFSLTFSFCDLCSAVKTSLSSLKMSRQRGSYCQKTKYHLNLILFKCIFKLKHLWDHDLLLPLGYRFLAELNTGFLACLCQNLVSDLCLAWSLKHCNEVRDPYLNMHCVSLRSCRLS